ncbi:helix-turn-helix domain-containing protein [Nonomuraea sp. LP-02]|uniref:TetR/AcrR family transcriptional regulator n=1 Tax=Nonomuraea sp. LP-02 TaxID=3097960 RepID=UPI002E36293D|nr:helix-turn-helix domain-containing protein [Nonomuraea sp. LP-02]MED7924587.1 helix-turn-helix domain-containing protein [Nonomuraea sp. LP-02]
MTAAPAAGRADARRNRELVLRAATRVFTEEGTGASLGRVARRAGVGAGTVYRHFPSKEILIEAVLAEHVEDLVSAAGRWRARATPGDALFGFLLEVIDRSAGRRHVCDALTDHGWPRAVLAAGAQRFREAMERLLREAKQAGAIRADLRGDDLAALAVGGVALRSAHQDAERGARLVRLMLDGLRARAVTEPEPFRDQAAPARHGTTGPRHCAECGEVLRVHATGRPPRYCGPPCRPRAHRRRRATEPAVPD